MHLPGKPRCWLIDIGWEVDGGRTLASIGLECLEGLILYIVPPYAASRMLTAVCPPRKFSTHMHDPFRFTGGIKNALFLDGSSLSSCRPAGCNSQGVVRSSSRSPCIRIHHGPSPSPQTSHYRPHHPFQPTPPPQRRSRSIRHPRILHHHY